VRDERFADAALSATIFRLKPDSYNSAFESDISCFGVLAGCERQ
jgi:hypothetical protein